MIFAVVTSQRIGIFPIGARFPRPAEAFDDPIGMVGMDGLGPAPARPLLRIGAGELVPSTIVPDRTAVLVGEPHQLGRASCRERVCQYVLILVVDGTLKKKKQNNTPRIIDQQ